ncbi:hypothetical protein [Brevibacillus centrosporus]|uniref:hypothetical protein n=1 Tax=Brevibacillus centrosporus TaxID=54910 RepID=UPI002E1E2016|nr:hypothetical protein [Brevibacillus centrosporus]
MIEATILEMIKSALPSYCMCAAGRPAVKDKHIHMNDERIAIPLERPIVFFVLDTGFDNPKGYGHNERLKAVDLDQSEFVFEKSTEVVKGYSVYCWLPVAGKYGGELTRVRIFDALQEAFAFEDKFTLKLAQDNELPPDEGATQAIFELTYTGVMTKERREAGFTEFDLSPSYE